MYRCLVCGCEFTEDEFDFVIETHGLDTPPYESIAVCPQCGDSYYEEFDEKEELEEE